jgi:hypothetical protein
VAFGGLVVVMEESLSFLVSVLLSTSNEGLEKAALSGDVLHSLPENCVLGQLSLL